MKKSRQSAPTRQNSPVSTNAVLPISLPLFLLTGLLLIYATHLWFPTSAPTPLTLSLAFTQKYPWVAGNHLTLAEVYYASGNLLQAQAELTVAQDMLTYTNAASPSVLGDMSLLSALQTKIETSPAEHQEKRAFWQELLVRHPNYRDAWVQLLYLSYNAGDIAQARFYLEKVNVLYPNFVQELPATLRSL